jgi:hypothetical protein
MPAEVVAVNQAASLEVAAEQQYLDAVGKAVAATAAADLILQEKLLAAGLTPAVAVAEE